MPLYVNVRSATNNALSFVVIVAIRSAFLESTHVRSPGRSVALGKRQEHFRRRQYRLMAMERPYLPKGPRGRDGPLQRVRLHTGRTRRGMEPDNQNVQQPGLVYIHLHVPIKLIERH